MIGMNLLKRNRTMEIDTSNLTDEQISKLSKVDKPEPKEDKEWMYAQRKCNELGADYFAYQGYHPPKK